LQAGPTALAGLGPRRDATRALGDGPRGRGSGEELEQAAVKKWAAGPKTRRKNIFIFFFLFNYFKVFSNYFES
jgi:hypothetical protein